MTETNRQQRVVERILEDESLRGDLEDPVATALINWASERAGTIAADPARSDAAVDAASLAIRAAARQAASSGEREPERVVALAEAALAKQSPPNQDEVAGSTPRQPAAPAATGESRSDDAETAAPRREVTSRHGGHCAARCSLSLLSVSGRLDPAGACRHADTNCRL